MKPTINEARVIIQNCAKKYNEKLLHKKFMIIYRDVEDNKIKFIEVAFAEHHYQHLTGIQLIDKNKNIIRGQAFNFYRKCLHNKIGNNEIKFRDDGTTALKLKALPVLTDMSKIVRITGDYNNSRPYLYVDKIIGGVNFCLGLVGEKDYYVPSSALLEDIRNLSLKTSQVLGILEKEISEDLYTKIKYIDKGVNFYNINLPDNIRQHIAIENI